MRTNSSLTLEWNLDAGIRRGKPRKGAAPVPAATERTPQNRLMALAVKFDGMLREDVVTDYADLARLGLITRARMTQIMNLLNLAPNIQEQIMFLPERTEGRETVAERNLRPQARIVSWGRQRKLWRNLAKTFNPVAVVVADGVTLTPTG
jgi:hypothetical protein